MKEEGAKSNTVEGTEKPLTEQQLRIREKAFQAAAARELADYKKRLKESVELKRLQVEELELNIKYFHLKEEHSKIAELIAEAEAKHQAEMKAAEELAAKENEIKIEPARTGKVRETVVITEEKEK